MKRRVSPEEMANIMRAANSFTAKKYTAAFVCTYNKNLIFFDAEVRVAPRVKEVLNRSQPSGEILIPDYIPEDAQSMTFVGVAVAEG